jgi:hypothetical protein
LIVCSLMVPVSRSQNGRDDPTILDAHDFRGDMLDVTFDGFAGDVLSFRGVSVFWPTSAGKDRRS